MTDTGAKKKAWAVLAYTVADDKGEDAALDRSAERELRAFYDAADFSQISIAAQVDFKKAERGVYRAVLTAAPAESDGFKDIRTDETPLWRQIKKTLERSVLHVQHERSDLTPLTPASYPSSSSSAAPSARRSATPCSSTATRTDRWASSTTARRRNATPTPSG